MSYKVIVADDDVVIRRALIALLKQQESIEVVAECGSFEQLKDSLKEEKPDALFIDINMNGMSGIEFLEQYKQEFPQVSVVIVSAIGDTNTLIRALRLGVDDYILKPVTDAEFQKLLTRLLKRLQKKKVEQRYLNQTKDLLRKNRKYLISEFMNNWLTGHYKEDEIADKMNYLFIDIPKKYQIVMLTLMTDMKEDIDSQWDTDLLYYAAENITSEIFADLGPLYISRIGDESLVIVSKCGATLQVEDMIEKARDTIEKYLPVRMSIFYKEGEGYDKAAEVYDLLLKEESRLHKCSAIVKDIRAYIEKNFRREELSLIDAAEYVNLSPQHLSRIFKKEIGITFVDYLTRLRIKKAIDLFEQDDLKMYEIAERVGYSTQHYFSSVFKKMMGISPAEYRRNIKSKKKK
ncbi:MAG: response regulator [Lachnospiraceae bacterium]|nr:response regulator [Lachnospiraceae bacterium]